MAAVSESGVRADWLTAFQPLAASGNLRCDMDPGQPGHGDGWGMIAYFKPDFPEYLDREPHSAVQDPENYKKDARSVEAGQVPVALVHFRKISVGRPSISNTHPFTRGAWAFAHNGTIYDSDRIPLKRSRPAGGTDSERFFLHLLENLEDAGTNLTEPKAVARDMKEILWKFKQDFKFSSLTFLLTDGKTVYVYRESGERRFDDYYTLYTADLDGGRLVSSQPLQIAGARWEPVSNESLIALPPA